MSDFLNNMIARQANQIEVIQPRLRTLFEPPPISSGGQQAVPDLNSDLPNEVRSSSEENLPAAPITPSLSQRSAEAMRSEFEQNVMPGDFNRFGNLLMAPMPSQLSPDNVQNEQRPITAEVSSEQIRGQRNGSAEEQRLSYEAPLPNSESMLLHHRDKMQIVVPDVRKLPDTATGGNGIRTSGDKTTPDRSASIITRPKGDNIIPDQIRSVTTRPEGDKISPSPAAAVTASSEGKTIAELPSMKLRPVQASQNQKISAAEISTLVPQVSLPIGRQPLGRAEAKTAAPQPPPTVQVTIGRIEVRATQPPVASARKQQSAPPLMSLAEYLEKRSRRNGK